MGQWEPRRDSDGRTFKVSLEGVLRARLDGRHRVEQRLYKWEDMRDMESMEKELGSTQECSSSATVYMYVV